MDATELLSFLAHTLKEAYSQTFDCRAAFCNPRNVGAFGETITDRFTQPVTIDGEKFFITVEKDINQ